jgi:hypothetical protein
MPSKEKIWSLALLESLCKAPLLAGDLPEAPSFDRSSLDPLEKLPSLNFEQKLGHLYEDSLHALLEHSPAHRLLTAGLQVADERGQTMGELDFLLGEPGRGQGIHLELAVKFYLAHFDGDAWQYPGPNPRDCWQAKLERLRFHQLRLTQDPRVRADLLRRFELERIFVRQLIYGRLFYPMSATGVPLPERMNPHGLRGRWLKRSEWQRYVGTAETVRVIPKPLWPVRISRSVLATLESVSSEAVLKRTASRCTLCVADDDRDQPIFVVPDTWPSP